MASFCTIFIVLLVPFAQSQDCVAAKFGTSGIAADSYNLNGPDYKVFQSDQWEATTTDGNYGDFRIVTLPNSLQIWDAKQQTFVANCTIDTSTPNAIIDPTACQWDTRRNRKTSRSRDANAKLTAANCPGATNGACLQGTFPSLSGLKSTPNSLIFKKLSDKVKIWAREKDDLYSLSEPSTPSGWRWAFYSPGASRVTARCIKADNPSANPSDCSLWEDFWEHNEKFRKAEGIFTTTDCDSFHKDYPTPSDKVPVRADDDCLQLYVGKPRSDFYGMMSKDIGNLKFSKGTLPFYYSTEDPNLKEREMYIVDGYLNLFDYKNGYDLLNCTVKSDTPKGCTAWQYQDTDGKWKDDAGITVADEPCPGPLPAGAGSNCYKLSGSKLARANSVYWTNTNLVWKNAETKSYIFSDPNPDDPYTWVLWSDIDLKYDLACLDSYLDAPHPLDCKNWNIRTTGATLHMERETLRGARAYTCKEYSTTDRLPDFGVLDDVACLAAQFGALSGINNITDLNGGGYTKAPTWYFDSVKPKEAAGQYLVIYIWSMAEFHLYKMKEEIVLAKCKLPADQFPEDPEDLYPDQCKTWNLVTAIEGSAPIEINDIECDDELKQRYPNCFTMKTPIFEQKGYGTVTFGASNLRIEYFRQSDGLSVYAAFADVGGWSIYSDPKNAHLADCVDPFSIAPTPMDCKRWKLLTPDGKNPEVEARFLECKDFEAFVAPNAEDVPQRTGGECITLEFGSLGMFNAKGRDFSINGMSFNREDQLNYFNEEGKPRFEIYPQIGEDQGWLIYDYAYGLAGGIVAKCLGEYNDFPDCNGKWTILREDGTFQADADAGTTPATCKDSKHTVCLQGKFTTLNEANVIFYQRKIPTWTNPIAETYIWPDSMPTSITSWSVWSEEHERTVATCLEPYSDVLHPLDCRYWGVRQNFEQQAAWEIAPGAQAVSCLSYDDSCDPLAQTHCLLKTFWEISQSKCDYYINAMSCHLGYHCENPIPCSELKACGIKCSK